MAAQPPPWIWAIIIQYIPDDVLGTLIGLNRVFLEYGMEARYAQLHVRPDRRTPIPLKTIVRLRDPAITRLVRRLRVVDSDSDDRNGKADTKLGTSYNRCINLSILKVAPQIFEATVDVRKGEYCTFSFGSQAYLVLEEVTRGRRGSLYITKLPRRLRRHSCNYLPWWN